ncbi:MAG TPA: sigma-70 family RNA polymerase sigma factor [Actinomycetota bacterium]|nr:sigma-70 family RNA polymerase sigma factor [Actinomycetota bacterium]
MASQPGIEGALGRRSDGAGDAPGTIEEQETYSLVERARTGDREAYAMLFDRFHDEIYRFATRRIGDPVAGQDAAAETFADAFSGIRRFHQTGAPFEAWLYTIARRRIVDQVRMRARHEHAELPSSDMGQPSSSGHEPSVVDAMLLRGLIARLSETERDVLELRFMEDLDVEQTALRLGKQPGGIRVIQHRALTKLRTMMAEEAR